MSRAYVLFLSFSRVSLIVTNYFNFAPALAHTPFLYTRTHTHTHTHTLWRSRAQVLRSIFACRLPMPARCPLAAAPRSLFTRLAWHSYLPSFYPSWHVDDASVSHSLCLSACLVLCLCISFNICLSLFLSRYRSLCLSCLTLRGGESIFQRQLDHTR